MNTTKRITVLLADDHTVVREGLRSLLEAEGDIEVVGEAATGREAVELMDIAMPLLNGLEATRQIRKALPITRILILSAHSDDAYVDQVMELGAAGYLIKQTSARVLSQAVREVQQGRTFLCPAIARGARREQGQSPDPRGLVRRQRPSLSPRETEVLQLIAEGKANKQVAAVLGISVKTVEKHRQRLMEKLNIHDTAGLTRYALAAGVIESSVQVTVR
jgi:DNA-binding NarL/FixJ family response regulator